MAEFNAYVMECSCFNAIVILKL